MTKRTPRVLTDDPLLKVAEVADRLRVSKMTVYRLIHQGIAGNRLKAVKIGRSFRVPQSEVDRLISASFFE